MTKKPMLLGVLALSVAGGTFLLSNVATGAAFAATANMEAKNTAEGISKPVVGWIKIAAKVLNTTPQTLENELRAGQSIAQVAQNKGVSEQQVVNAIVRDLSAFIDKRVQSGMLAEEKANQLKAELPDRVKQMVEHKTNKKHSSARSDGAMSKSTTIRRGSHYERVSKFFVK